MNFLLSSVNEISIFCHSRMLLLASICCQLASRSVKKGSRTAALTGSSRKKSYRLHACHSRQVSAADRNPVSYM